MKLQADNCHSKLRSKPFPLMFISRYFIPGIWTGSDRALLDCTRAGILRSPWRFLTWFACSVLGVLVGGKIRMCEAYTVLRSMMVLMPYSSRSLFLSSKVASSIEVWISACTLPEDM